MNARRRDRLWHAARPGLLILAGALAAAPAAAAEPAAQGDAATAAPSASAGADWPCVQRRAGTISAGVVWTGPDLAQAGAWDKDFEAAALAQKLASRRTPIEEVDGLLDAFADKAGSEKAVRLTRVFAGVLDLINAERNRILLGITRYARGQNKLAERVRLESDQIGEATDAPNADTSKAVQDLETALKWDRRIFEERGKSLTYVCETPVILERRVFDVARRIAQRL